MPALPASAARMRLRSSPIAMLLIRIAAMVITLRLTADMAPNMEVRLMLSLSQSLHVCCLKSEQVRCKI